MRKSENKKKGFVIWFTGLPCSGKTTISKALESELKDRHQLPVQHLDGDSVRSVFPSIGFTEEDRNRHVQQMGFLSSMLSKNGVNCVASFVSPFSQSRDFCKSICDQFIEVHVSTPVEECEKRDVKGLYKQARDGKLLNFTGVNHPYEEPVDPSLRIDTSNKEPAQSVAEVLDYLKKEGHID